MTILMVHVGREMAVIQQFDADAVHGLQGHQFRGLPIPMIVIYTNLDDLVKITVIENYIKEMENEKLVGNVVFMTR